MQQICITILYLNIMEINKLLYIFFNWAGLVAFSKQATFHFHIAVEILSFLPVCRPWLAQSVVDAFHCSGVCYYSAAQVVEVVNGLHFSAIYHYVVIIAVVDSQCLGCCDLYFQPNIPSDTSSSAFASISVILCDSRHIWYRQQSPNPAVAWWEAM